MERTLKIELPDDLYEMLQKFAEKSGQTPEQFAQEWLSHALEISKTDPLESFIGAFNTALEDWAERHDVYLGLEEAINSNLQEKKE